MELRRVLTNLIGNAIKFTDQGEITVRCGLHCNSDEAEAIEIEIEDTGRGISPQEQLTVFERYRQGDHMRAGSGLGLHLVACIVKAHGGQVSVTSAEGQGSTFTVLLPRQAIASTPEQAEPAILQSVL